MASSGRAESPDMASRNTTARILNTALDLFNRHGSTKISTNRIAAETGLSKGNLNYHYRDRGQIVLDLFSSLRNEILEGWSGDHQHPTLEHMAFMFRRQLMLAWKYRFFYREMADLLNADPLLRQRFNELRVRRIAALRQFFEALAGSGHVSLPLEEEKLQHFLTATWVLSEHWLTHIETLGEPFDEAALQRGHGVLMTMVKPYLRETDDRDAGFNPHHQALASERV